MIEYFIIKTFLKYEYFSSYKQHFNVTFVKNNYKDLLRIYYALEKHYESSIEDIGSVDALALIVFSQYPSLSETDKQALDIIFERIANTEVKEELVLNYLEAHQQRALAADVARVALEVADGGKSVESLIDISSKLKPRLITREWEFVPNDLQKLYASEYSQTGLRWRLETLNKMLGSLRKGNFGFIFKRPEVGGTTLMASEVTYMAAQTNRPILWFNNEQAGEEVQLRLYQAALGISLKDLFADIEGNQQRYLELTKGNILQRDSALISRDEVDAMCADLKPALIVFDQIDKIKGFQNDRKTQELGSIYQWARELAKEYCPVVGVCQASATAENKKWLEMSDIDESKTSKPAEADWILGVGRVYDEGMSRVRFLHACKNKLHGDADTIPNMRHGREEVLIREEIARYEDIKKYT